MAEDERKELLGKIDSLESILRMLELKTKNSHDHGTNATDTSTSSPHRTPSYSRVDYFPFFFFMLALNLRLFIIFHCYFQCMHFKIIGSIHSLFTFFAVLGIFYLANFHVPFVASSSSLSQDSKIARYGKISQDSID